MNSPGHGPHADHSDRSAADPENHGSNDPIASSPLASDGDPGAAPGGSNVAISNSAASDPAPSNSATSNSATSNVAASTGSTSNTATQPVLDDQTERSAATPLGQSSVDNRNPADDSPANGHAGSGDGSDSPTAEMTDVKNERRGDDFGIVGIGASAGGLEAIEELLASLTDEIHVAIVVVQHLSPDFDSHMKEVLSRKTKIPIELADDGTVVRPGRVYLNLPKSELRIEGGKLRLRDRDPKVIAHSIDHFFESLAGDVGDRAIAVVLSGTGSDGARGGGVIKRNGGWLIAQDPDTAKFDGMPTAAIRTGKADLVLSPAEIANVLKSHGGEGFSSEPAPSGYDVSLTRGLQRIFQILCAQHGIAFEQYKCGTVERRIQRRMELNRIRRISEYIERLEEDANEVNALYKDLLIGVTQFFRDAKAFESLEINVIEPLVHSRTDNRPIRVWVAGCATGEEAYSIAMAIDRVIDRTRSSTTFKVFATDAHAESLQTAAAGVYSLEQIDGLDEKLVSRYFDRNGEKYAITPSLRRNIVFAPHNLLSDAPFTQMDLITCRNMMIYFEVAAQQRALSLFHFSLRPGGVLFLGSSETTGMFAQEFDEIDKRWRIYRKIRDVRLPLATPFQPTSETMLATGTNTRSIRNAGLAAVPRTDPMLTNAFESLLERRLPPSILIDFDSTIQHVFAGGEKYLSYTSGRPSSYVLDALVDPLKTIVSGAIRHAKRRGSQVRFGGVAPIGDKRSWGEGDDSVGSLTIRVEPLAIRGRQSEPMYLIAFEPDEMPAQPTTGEDVDLGRLTRERIEQLETDLRYSQDNLQATIEEMETANEELQATNEELTASNEELQSTNEELHSVNEELFTVNAEHQRRVVELTEATTDMDNLLATTRVGVIFLDESLYIRRFTPEIGRVFGLEPGDVGRSIESFVLSLQHESLLTDLQKMYRDKTEREIKVRDKRGLTYLCRMTPYRTGDLHDSGNVQGVVISLYDVTRLTSTQLQLERLKFMLDASSDFCVLMNLYGDIHYANPALAHELNIPLQELQTSSIFRIQSTLTSESFTEFRQSLESVPEKPFESRLHRKDGTSLAVEFVLSATRFNDQSYVFALIRDIRYRVRVEQQMRLQTFAIESARDAIIIADIGKPDIPIVYVNKGFEAITGYPSEEVMGRNCRFLQGPDTDPEVVQRIRRAIERREDSDEILLNYTKDGRPFYNQLKLTPVPDSEGRITHYVGIQRDVTSLMTTRQRLENTIEQLRRREDELQVSEQAAQVANRSKTEFLANISHELRTPMTAVLGFTEMLRAESDDDTQSEKLETISSNGNYLLALLNDILDLSKIEAGQLAVRGETIDLVSLVDDLRELLDVRSRDKDIPLRFVYETAVPRTFVADRTRIRQVLVNLIANAVKFTDEGKVIVTIAMRPDPDAIDQSGNEPNAKGDAASDDSGSDDSGIDDSGIDDSGIDDGGDRDPSNQNENIDGNGHNAIADSADRDGDTINAELVFRIIDSGIGIPQEMRDRLFEPFQRGTDQNREGTGLGLSIAKRLTVAMGGSLDVESQVGVGSTFTLTLPLQLPKDDPFGPDTLIRFDRPASSSRRHVIPPVSQTRPTPYRILVADDRQEVRYVIEYFLKSTGAEVVAVENGRLAVEEVRRSTDAGHAFDVLLLDMHMPVLDGTAAVRELRDGGFTAPIIAITADAMDGQKERYLDAGCDDVIAKPIDSLDLNTRVIAAVDNHRSAD